MPGTYKCKKDGASDICYNDINMMVVSNWNGYIQCASDLLCTIDGERIRRLMLIDFTLGGTTAVRGINFLNGISLYGGATYHYGATIVSFTLCTFRSNSSTSTATAEGGGAVYVSSSQCVISFYGCSFSLNSAAPSRGNDIYRNAGSVTIYSGASITCPAGSLGNANVVGTVALNGKTVF